MNKKKGEGRQKICFSEIFSLEYNILLWGYILKKSSSWNEVKCFLCENARNTYSDSPKIYLNFASCISQNDSPFEKFNFFQDEIICWKISKQVYS